MSERWGPVHGGVISGIYKDGAPLDDCNAYCTAEVHCSLFYATEGIDLERLRTYSQLAFNSIEITRIEKAPEAPPISNDARDHMIHYGPNREEPVVGYLMFWKLR